MNKNTITGKSPFGMSRKFRRKLFSMVRRGTANEREVERFKSLGKDAYPWISFRGVIRDMIKKSLSNK